MSYKHLLSLSLLTFIIQACGDTPDEKKLKRRNNELSQQNDQTAAERDAALKNKEAAAADLAKAQEELESAKQNLTKAQADKAAAEKAKATLETELAAKQKTASELNEQIKAKDTSIAAKELEITNLRATVASGNTEVADLQTKLNAAEGQVKTLTEERSKLNTALAEANKASAAVKAELEAQLVIKDKVVKEKEGEIANLIARLDTMTSNPDLATAQAEIIKLKEERDQLKTTLAQANTASADVKAKLEAELAAMDKTVKEKEGEIANLSAQAMSMNTDLAAAQSEITKLKEEHDQLKTALAEANTASAGVKADLEAQLAARDKVVKEKEGEITTLTAKLEAMANNQDVEAARAEINKLKAERDQLKTALAQAEAGATAAAQELEAAKKKISDLESRRTGILEKSLVDIHGLWLNEDEVSGIADATCYEFVHLAVNGSFAQAIACSDGRVQIQKYSFDRFGAQGVPEQTENDYMASYGFAVDGAASSSTCQDPAASILQAGSRLVFEMTRQDFDRDYGNLMSKNMVVAGAQGLKGFTNAALNFANNRLDYAAMNAIANRANAGALSKSAAAFLGGLQGQGTNITLGCFDANGVFTATSSN